MTDRVTIRHLSIGDLAACESYFPSPASAPYAEQISRQSTSGYSLYGLFFEEQLAGMIHIRRQGPKDPQIGKLYPQPVQGNLYVRSDFRNRGYARQLLAHCESTLGSEGYHKIGLIVSTANQSAISLYESLGYAPQQQFPARPERDEVERLYYQKTI